MKLGSFPSLLAVVVTLAFISTLLPLRLALSDAAQFKALFKPIPKVVDNPENPVTPDKVALGKKLYMEPRLSESGEISCNSCHNLETYGVDREPTSPGHEGKRGDRNSPTVFNAALHIAQFWDGRAKDVEEQALGPVMNPIEMAMPSQDKVVAMLKGDTEYPAMFAKAFPSEKDPVTFENMGKAIGAFERTLMTPSRFDDYLNGDDAALSEEEQRGLETFVNVGCATCHMGVGLGGLMYQKLGLVKPYPTEDTGRFKVTQNEADKFYFKVPSLRNVEQTYPYYHDGSVATLEEAVEKMADYQLGKKLNQQETSDIIAFLKSLTGELPKDL